jgi:hypothetical protein
VRISGSAVLAEASSRLLADLGLPIRITQHRPREFVDTRADRVRAREQPKDVQLAVRIEVLKRIVQEGEESLFDGRIPRHPRA